MSGTNRILAWTHNAEQDEELADAICMWCNEVQCDPEIELSWGQTQELDRQFEVARRILDAIEEDWKAKGRSGSGST